MAMGGKKTSEQGSPLGQREILQDPGGPELGICRHRKTRRWNATRAHPATRIGYANPAAYQDQSQRQCARPRMGALLRAPMGHENAELIKRPCELSYCRIFSIPCPTLFCASGLFDRSVQNQRRN